MPGTPDRQLEFAQPVPPGVDDAKRKAVAYSQKYRATERGQTTSQAWQDRNRERLNRIALKYYAERTERLHEIKRSLGPCMDCGGTFHPVCMDFDHRPGEVKLGDMQYMRMTTHENMMAEIAKCDIVCANCHRLRTYQRNEHKRLRVKAGAS